MNQFEAEGDEYVYYVQLLQFSDVLQSLRMRVQSQSQSGCLYEKDLEVMLLSDTRRFWVLSKGKFPLTQILTVGDSTPPILGRPSIPICKKDI